MKNTIIYLLGFPGTGKYTIAKEICKQADFKLVDNHLINNPLFTLIENDDKRFYRSAYGIISGASGNWLWTR